MENRCRLCAEYSADQSNVLDDADLIVRIFQLFHVKISIEDKLPTTVCELCVETVKQTWDFSQHVQKSQEVLNAMLNTETNQEVKLSLEATGEEVKFRPTEQVQTVKKEDLSQKSPTSKMCFSMDERADLRDSEEAANTSTPILPERSKVRYNQAYESFLKWCTTKDVVNVSENVMLAYFTERSEALKSPASLWSEYSMLKLTISMHKNEDISKFNRLKAFLKKKNNGYVPRKSKIFTKEQIDKFLVEAPDQIYLMMKVVAIMGVSGACRTDELHRMKLKDIELKDDIAIVKVLETKNNTRRTFVVTKNTEGTVDWLNFVKSYIKVRPKNAADERLFFRYERGRCVNQVVGRHTISKVSREIAKFLKLDNIAEYTGHAFRRTSTTISANSHDVNVLDFGGWKSSTVAGNYVADSFNSKMEVDKIFCIKSENTDDDIEDVVGDSNVFVDNTLDVDRDDNFEMISEDRKPCIY